MDKAQAEAILELTEAYDYGALRRAWRKLCADYHPDKCVATGMDRAAADEVLKDINEAFATLKPLVEPGGIVQPEGRGSKNPSDSSSQVHTGSVEQQYALAVMRALTARTASDFDVAAVGFSGLGSYRDSETLMKACLQCGASLRKKRTIRKANAEVSHIVREVEEKYRAAIKAMEKLDSKKGYQAYLDVADQFAELGSYKGADRQEAFLRSKAMIVKAGGVDNP